MMHYEFPLLDRVKLQCILFALYQPHIWVLRWHVFDAGKAQFMRLNNNQRLTETRLSTMLES